MRPGCEKNTVALDCSEEIQLAQKLGMLGHISVEGTDEALFQDNPVNLSADQTNDLIYRLISKRCTDAAYQVRLASWSGGTEML